MTREEAIQVCNDVQSMYWFLSDKIKDAMGMAVEALKQPERKKGYWVVDEDGNIECSECGYGGCGDNYCERCGADMRKEKTYG